MSAYVCSTWWPYCVLQLFAISLFFSFFIVWMVSQHFSTHFVCKLQIYLTLFYCIKMLSLIRKSGTFVLVTFMLFKYFEYLLSLLAALFSFSFSFFSSCSAENWICCIIAHRVLSRRSLHQFLILSSPRWRRWTKKTEKLCNRLESRFKWWVKVSCRFGKKWLI